RFDRDGESQCPGRGAKLVAGMVVDAVGTLDKVRSLRVRVDEEHRAARREHARDLSKCLVHPGNVVRRLEAQDDVEYPGPERKLLRGEARKRNPTPVMSLRRAQQRQ